MTEENTLQRSSNDLVFNIMKKSTEVMKQVNYSNNKMGIGRDSCLLIFSLLSGCHYRSDTAWDPVVNISPAL